MAKKKTADSAGFVYSTDPDFKYNFDNEEAAETVAPEKQPLKVYLDTRQRAGKAVTIVEHFTGSAADLEDLGKKLKSYCGTGGAVKEGLIIIQGDQREKVLQYLLKAGYSKTKRR